MVYVLAVVIALIVVDGVCSPDGFSNIRTAYRTIRGIRYTPQAETSQPHCPTCKCGTPGIWLPVVTTEHEAAFLRDDDDY